MEEKPTQSREGVKGGFPLAGSRGSAPCGVWGNAPTVPRPTNSKEAANKSAGSEASLPVTSRVLRRAPKLLYPLLAHCRAKWARPHSRSTTPRPCFFPPNGYPTPKGYKKNQRHKTAGFFNLQKYSLLQLRQMNPQEHQHVRHKLARRGARFMRRGIPPRQGAVKRNVLLLPRLVDGRANRAFYRQRRRAVSPRNGRVDFHRHAARLNGLTQEIQNRIHQIVEAGQTRRHAERRQQTGNFPLRRDLRFRQGQLRRLRAGGCSGRRHGRHGLCGSNGLRCLCTLHRSAKRDERNCLLYRETVHFRRH